MDSQRPGSRPDTAGEACPLRAIVVSPVHFYRDGVARLLGEHGVDVLASCALGHTACERIAAANPDVVLLDVSCEDGLRALHEIAECVPQVRVVALAVSGSETVVWECAQAGVAGYVTSDASFEQLLAIISSVARGELRCLPLAAGALRRRLAALAADPPSGGTPVLTGREAEILHLLERGLSNKEIAARLVIEVSTVKSQVHSILEKLHVRRRADAASRLRGYVAGRAQIELRLPDPAP